MTWKHYTPSIPPGATYIGMGSTKSGLAGAVVKYEDPKDSPTGRICALLRGGKAYPYDARQLKK